MSNTARFVYLRGVRLLEALAYTKMPVKWKRESDSVHIDAAQARVIAQHGNYEGKFWNQRVHSIRLIADRRPPLDDSHYWDDRPILRYQIERCVTRYMKDGKPTRAQNKERADLWDKMLQRSEVPASWRPEPQYEVVCEFI